MDRVSVAAPAKINLYLKITGRREDGYHFLASLMQKVGLRDTLLIEKKTSGIILHCPESNLPEDNRNLVFQAAMLFFERSRARMPGMQSGAGITLTKKIPISAGLGGGSSDAAATLLGLDALFDTQWSVEELKEMGVTLGADVPFFIVDWPVAWAEGIGDQLFPAVPLAAQRIIIVNPGFSVSTEWAYKKFALTFGEKNNNLTNCQNNRSVQGLREKLIRRSILPEELENDLERVTIDHYPELDVLKKRLLQGGAAAALMSGSGPSVFGIFLKGDEEKADACHEELKRKYRNTFLVEPLH